MKNDDFDKILFEFIEAFEEVFDKDWNYTKEMCGIYDETEEQIQNAQQMGLEPIDIISSDGTFINPKVDDETENWGNRGQLLKNYRRLKELINQKQLSITEAKPE